MRRVATDGLMDNPEFRRASPQEAPRIQGCKPGNGEQEGNISAATWYEAFSFSKGGFVPERRTEPHSDCGTQRTREQPARQREK